MGIPQIKHLYSTEAQAACLTHRSQTALQDSAPAALTEAAVDRQGSELWSEAPDVVEGDAGEVQAPAQGEAAAEQRGETAVAAVLTSVETLVACSPYTVH